MSAHELGSLKSWKHWSLRVCCLGLFLVLAAQAATAQSTTVVSPVAGNPTSSGTALRNALAGISSPSSTNPWLLKIEPGIYDIGSTALPMRSWVDVEGSGIGVTIIRGTVDVTTSPSHGTVDGASNAELRLLTVEAIGTSTVPNVAAVFNDSAFPRFYRVKLVAQDTHGGVVYGMRNYSSGPRIEECEINASSTSAGATAYGVAFKNNFSGARAVILRSQILASGVNTTYGVSMLDRLTLAELRDSRIDAISASTNYGIFADQNFGWSGNEQLTIRNTEVSAAGGSSTYGVHFDTCTASVEVAGSKIWGHVGSSNNYGIYHAGSGSAVVQGSSIVGSTATVAMLGSAMISTTELNGGSASAAGWIGCAGVWDESAVFYSNTCP
jgi:hypothetical protein